MAHTLASIPSTQDSTALPRGLRWRGDVLWINKKINGKRYQLSTGCKDLIQGTIVFEEFLLQHGVKMSGPFRNCGKSAGLKMQFSSHRFSSIHSI
jgi:hypothetical protein